MTIQLPSFDHIGTGPRKGRNLYEGYQRGVGLEFGNLRAEIDKDRDYRDALRYAKGRTIVAEDRLRNLFLLMKFFLPAIGPGDVVEFGSYNGGSAFFMAALARKFLPGTQVYGLDTFTGMPPTDPAVDAHRRGDFSTNPFDEILEAKRKFGLDNVHFVKGLFEDTAAQMLSGARPILLAHIDCDIYEAVKFAYRVSRPSMAKGGYFVFDDATTSTCVGAMEAVEECVVQDDGLHAEQVFPHFVFRNPAGFVMSPADPNDRDPGGATAGA